jgi:hypothetical protein
MITAQAMKGLIAGMRLHISHFRLTLYKNSTYGENLLSEIAPGP